LWRAGAARRRDNGSQEGSGQRSASGRHGGIQEKVGGFWPVMPLMIADAGGPFVTALRWQQKGNTKKKPIGTGCGSAF
jgi:hypothetical protein